MSVNLLWAIAFGICPQRPSHKLFFGSLAVFGVPILLGGLNTVLFATFTGRANQATNGRTALPVVLGGLLLAGRLLGTFSTVRLALFGPGPLKLRPR